VSTSVSLCARPCLLLQSTTLNHFTGYSESSLRVCVAEMHGIMAASATAQLQAVRKKYTATKYQEVATLPIPSSP
jgi:hypothetical protein